MTFKSASFKGYEIEMRRSRKMRSVPLWDNLRRELQIVTNVFKYNDSFHSEHFNNVKIIIFRKRNDDEFLWMSEKTLDAVYETSLNFLKIYQELIFRKVTNGKVPLVIWVVFKIFNFWLYPFFIECI